MSADSLGSGALGGFPGRLRLHGKRGRVVTVGSDRDELRAMWDAEYERVQRCVQAIAEADERHARRLEQIERLDERISATMGFIPPAKPGMAKRVPAKRRRSWFRHLTWIALLAWRGLFRDRFYRRRLPARGPYR